MGSVLKDVGKGVSDIGNFAIDAVFQMGTGGLVGYDRGKFKGGLLTSEVLEPAGKAIGKGVKDLTGATAAEQANELARQQYEESKLEAERQRQLQKDTRAANAMTASRASGRGRSNVNNTGDSKLSMGSFIGNDEKDFLGL